MTALVVGYGSIGARHARLLGELGHRVALLSRRALDLPNSYSDLGAALRAERPDLVIIANDTAAHRDSLVQLAASGYDGRVLIEKPLFAGRQTLPAHHFQAGWVGYNLRFHPLIQALRARLAGEVVLAAQFAVGQLLTQWRPGRDYAATYSASAKAGGGALRDLSHELDLAAWLFGPPLRLAAIGGRLGRLSIDSDDAWSLLTAHPGCPMVSTHLNYLDAAPRRDIHLTTLNHSFHADVIAGRLWVDGDPEDIPSGRDDSYLAMHRAILADDGETLCDLASGLAVMATIEAAERAVEEGRWIEV